jgi:CHASE2 domain-containing sensor protein
MIKRLLLEAVFATLVVFGVMGLFAIIPLNIAALQPLDAAVKDFDMVDLYYSQLKGNEGYFSKNVVLVNIGDAGREEIAELINYVSIGQPAAIGVDVFFDGLRGDSSDSLLAAAVRSNPNVVMSTFFDEATAQVKTSATAFNSGQTGYANFVGTDSRYSTIRAFEPQRTVGNVLHYSFGVQLALIANPNQASAFLKRSKPEEEIRFLGSTSSFLFFEKAQILNLEVDPELFAGKIVLVGYLGKTIDDANSIEDRFFTPLNEKISSRSLPDMSGMVVHANIIEMIVTEHWISGLSPRIVATLGVLITYLHVFFYMFLILKWELYFDALSKILQAISIVLMIYIVFLAFHYHNFKLDITLGEIGVALAADVLFVYQAIVNTLHKRLGWKSILIK